MVKLVMAKKLADQMGGVEQAKEVRDALAKLLVSNVGRVSRPVCAKPAGSARPVLHLRRVALAGQLRQDLQRFVAASRVGDESRQLSRLLVRDFRTGF